MNAETKSEHCSSIGPSLQADKAALKYRGASAKLNFPDEAIARNQAFNDLHYESDIVTLTTSHPAQAITGTSSINKFPSFMKTSPVPADLDSMWPPFLSSHSNFPDLDSMCPPSPFLSSHSNFPDLDSMCPPSPFLSSHSNFPRSGHDSNLNPLETSEGVTPSQFSSLSGAFSQQALPPLPSPYNPVCNMDNPISSTSVNAWNINGVPQQVGQCLPNGQERIPGLKRDFSLEEDTSMIASALHYDGSREGSATGDDFVQTQTDLQGPQDGQNIYYLSHDINTSGSKRSRSKAHEDINIRASSSTNNSAEAIRCHSSTFSKTKLGEGCEVGNENSRRTPYSGEAGMNAETKSEHCSSIGPSPQSLESGRTKYRGIRQRPSGKWTAEFRMSLGVFHTPEEAAREYDKAAIKYKKGTRAKLNLNFPDEPIARNQAFNDLHYESDISKY